ncbi:hypothetical protein IJJ53_00815 [Candidatus Saccharibacteria bacterium]|nr:hypothetical protein [Candidatus Saccharibacteria bacterium]
MKNLTTAEAAAVGGAVGAMTAFFTIFAIVFFVLMVVANWKIFKKAGEPGWKSIIPIYNVYIMFKIVNMKNWFWWLLGISIISSIITAVNNSTSFYFMSSAEIQATDITTIPAIVLVAMLVESIIAIWAGIVYAYRTSKVFGHGLGYTLGLIFLPNIFQLILAFGSSKYNIKRLKK